MLRKITVSSGKNRIFCPITSIEFMGKSIIRTAGYQPTRRLNMTNELSASQFLIYQAEDDRTKIDVRFEDESVWLTQQMMADLFQSSKQNISHHIKSIYNEGELQPEATVKKYLTVQTEGARQIKRQIEYYNLDVIISIGYRVKSHVATKFRI